MRVTPETSVAEIHAKALQLYRMRVCVVAVLGVAYFVASKIGGFSGFGALFLLLGAVEVLVNAPYPFLFKNATTALNYLAGSVMFDLMIETVAIHLIGGIDAMFFLAIYLLSIFYCAVNLPVALNFIMATLASLLYAGLVTLEYYGYLSHRSSLGLNLGGLMQASLVVSQVAFFYLMAFAARYLTQAMIDKEERLRGLLAEVRESNQRIKYSERMKTEFVAHLTHELRSPMNTVLGFASLLKEPAVGSLNEKQMDYLERIHRSAKHLLEVINDVLDISKLDAKKAKIQWEKISIPKLAENALEVFYEDAIRKGVQTNFENKAGEHFFAYVDARKTRQILYNLLSNAIKFTPQGGQISVALSVSKDVFILSVADTGIGIAASDQARIFDPYEQVNGPAHESLGTGLGLAITKRFVEMHGGQIRVESEARKGTRFILTFPIRTPAFAESLETSSGETNEQT